MIPVLTFHALDESPSPLAVPPTVFARGLAHLQERGFRSLSVREIADRLERRAPLPERTFALTFDDGLRSVREEALPVVRELGFTATVFLAVGPDPHSEEMLTMGGRPALTWRDAEELRDAGFELGAHTMTHPDLTRVSEERVDAEMRGSRAAIEERLDVRVTSFAYPYGRHDRRARVAARRHFSCACATRLGGVGPRSDRYAMERVDAHYLRTERLFRLLTSPALPWYLRARAIPRAARAALAGVARPIRATRQGGP